MKPLLFAVIVLTHFSVCAQNSYIGIKTGFALPEMKGEHENSLQMESFNSSTFGLVISTELGQLPLGLSFEPGFVLKGANTSSDTSTYRFQYLHMPVLLDYYPIQIVKLSAGLEPALLLKAKDTYPEIDTDLIETYNRFELSATFGLGISILYFLDLNFRYSLGLNQISGYDPILKMKNISSNYKQVSLIWKIAN